MKEGFPQDDNTQQEQPAFVGGDVYIPAWDRNGSVPPPITPEYDPPLQAPEEWDPNGAVPPPLPAEDMSAERMWVGKELGLPPPLPQEVNGEVVEANQEVQDSSVLESSEGEIPMPNIPILDPELKYLGLGPGGMYSEQWGGRLAEFIDEKRNLPPDAKIDIYHGLNSGLVTALKLLESSEQGIKQMGDAPCFAIYPVGQYWKPGDAGFRFSIPRGSAEFTGESKSDSKFRIDEKGDVRLVNGLDTLSLNEFEGEVLRTERMEDIYAKKNDPRRSSRIEPIGEKVVPLSDNEKEIGMKIEAKLGEFTLAREKKEIDKLEKSIRAELMGEN